MPGQPVRPLRVSLEVTAGIAHMRLARPDKRNAIDREMALALAETVARIESTDGVRSVLIAADGPTFTVGGDLEYIGSRIDVLANELDAMIRPYHVALAGLGALPLPVVCAVQGGAAGGGLGLLWCADYVLAADDLKIATGFPRLGLSGDGGSSWALPRLVGLRRARQLLLEGRTLGAGEALEWGIVDRVVPVDRLQPEAEAVAARLAAGPTTAIGHVKRLLRGAEGSGWSEQLDAERAAMVDCGRTADAREGIVAFNERRAPEFGADRRH
jgi:2-(1,2-epoxy-1,2-dihydrophenyl)acetyl-CoA isomerase